MMMLAQSAGDLDDGVAIEQGDPAVLDAVRRPEVHLAIWSRPLPDALRWITGLDHETIDDLTFHAELADIDRQISHELAEAGYPVSDGLVALGHDIAELAHRFAALLVLTQVKVRLEVIETDACRKFHADVVTARLLTTYAGQGTQWTQTRGGDDAPIRQMRAGDVGIFKGRLSVGEPQILHRSPPIAGTGESRLLLAIDPWPSAAPHPPTCENAS
ncbi:DUF1826 domain-containing protein [Novosphingobium sp. KACC 22771]|uniref:DUF1826 domain-containing protein n=1 Tax=Novosphingobium sp. KACC 22771 TaxID=3025670 RepID=UPI0023651013|nr:DUF1826 domain-containing protein [Novosphingobium sp. KACC 22771]WDF70924.1 DUF1826 domain-containing protein [Novosphingobium sp. KACC 22771]